ncbi:hypothetical protein KIW84_035226 [Lathyrus oleraceus]|uniref:Uncharacterized protein n=1 Tax=Pisum sativum TaxID=3888 RepID=A0A9D4Y1G9_PEA|nr:hypothetical protein KIW84_035226 [Pisum sativum]
MLLPLKLPQNLVLLQQPHSSTSESPTLSHASPLSFSSLPDSQLPEPVSGASSSHSSLSPPTPHIHPLNNHPTVTRVRDGIVQPRLHPTLLLTELEPTSYRIALEHPQWLAAMQAEHSALLQNNTWTLTNLPPNRWAVGYILTKPFSALRLLNLRDRLRVVDKTTIH